MSIAPEIVYAIASAIVGFGLAWATVSLVSSLKSKDIVTDR